MQYQLEHVAILCKDLKESIGFYEKLFGGKATPIRKGSAGYGFCAPALFCAYNGRT